MMQYFVNKAKNLKFTLRFCVVTILSCFLVVAFSIILPIVYYRLADDVSRVSFQLMSHISSQVYYRVKDEIENIEIVGQFSKDLIQTRVVDPRKHQEFIDYLTAMMKVETRTVESVQSAFWADETGNFVMVEKQLDGSIDTEVINRTVTPSLRTFIYRDAQGNMIKMETSQDAKYDPRTYPWYIAAKTQKKPSWTELYPFRITGFLGTTYITPVTTKQNTLDGVFILNVRIDFLRQFIEGIKVSKNGLLYLIQDDGVVVAFPHVNQQKTLSTIASLKKPWLEKSYQEFKRMGKKEFTFFYDKKPYLSVYQPIEHFGNHVWYIVVVAPQDDFIGDIADLDEITVWISCFVLLMGIVIVYLFIQRVMYPIKTLISETEKIKNFELGSDAQINSKIKEISQLFKAIDSMKTGLRSFQKYVPSSLVRQLIETGEDVRVGGVRKQLAIFFSDIKDFTQITEHTDPDILMRQICEYFEALSHIIIADRGTIDKFIGDSIMAIWGAPVSETYSCPQAAKAALDCEQCLVKLNKKWQAEGKSILFTRIGLHTGEAIVGNIGSTERLSYTAIGDAINITSRLEGLNKIYGTKIMVSEDFYQVVKNQFVFRTVDCVTLKGKEEPTFVYELLSEHRDELTFDICIYTLYFENGFTCYRNSLWDEAITQFTECLRVYPNDTVAKVFIHRCEQFKQQLP